MRTINRAKLVKIALTFGLTCLCLMLMTAKAVVYTNIVNPPASVSLAWDKYPVTNDTINLYYGVASRTYTNKLNLGYSWQYTIQIERGVRYFFTLTAVDPFGLESQFANEVSYIDTNQVPASPTGLQPPLVLQVQYKTNLLDIQWVNSGYVMPVYPNDATNRFYRLNLYANTPIPAKAASVKVLPAPTLRVLPEAPLPGK